MRRISALLTFAMVGAACGGTAPAVSDGTSTPSPAVSVGATAAPSATPRATPTLLATEAPTLSVELGKMTRRVRRGATARVSIVTEPGAECGITVTYDSGPSEAKGLRTKTAGRRGRVSWSWTVGRSTVKGTYPISVVCSAADSSGRLDLDFTVR